jgi:hypothetical protein
MEWILILLLHSGTVTVPRPFQSEAACIGAGETALPQCTAAVDLFDRVREVCERRRFVCVPQPKPPRGKRTPLHIDIDPLKVEIK